MIHFQDNFLFDMKQEFSLYFVIYMDFCLDLSKLKLIASCGGFHAWGGQRLLGPGHLVMLLAGLISHTSTRYIDFVNFLHFNGSVHQLFCSF